MGRITVHKLSRRDALRVCLLPAAGAATANWLIGCGGEEKSGLDEHASPNVTPDAASSQPSAVADSGVAVSDRGGTSTSRTDASPPPTSSAPGASGNAQDAAVGTSNPSVADASAADGASATPTDAGGGTTVVADANVPWATGGTKSMKGDYPDPFTMGAAGTACALYPSQTLGPCYAEMPPTRADISDGMTGLPVRLSFLVVGSNGCTPIPNASIDVWHSGFNGVYSAYRTGTICNPGREDVLSQRYCRGVQVTDQSGRVDFSTVFPGWYTGRTIHIHFTVRLNGREAVTSQLYFEDTLSDEILAQGEYAPRGRRDTTNRSDSIFSSGGARPEQVVMMTAKRPDGVLHAWKLLSVRGA